MIDNLPTHSPIGASSMSRWSKCPGSVNLAKGIPNKSSAYAEEGTDAHEHAAFRLIAGHWKNDISDEMKEAVQIYTHTIEWDFAEAGSRAQRGIEHRFDLTSIYPGLYGTADAWIYNPETKKLSVYDYKHGAGIAVEVKDNPQLKYYGLGALVSLGFPCETVELVIVQPRCPHPDGVTRRWSLPAVEMLNFAHDLEIFATRTEKADAPLSSGDHCRFCPAAAVCPELEKKAQAVAKLEFKELYDPAKLSEVLESLPVVEAWVKNVRDFAYSQAEAGKTIPGWKLVAKRSTRKWRNPEEISLFLENEFPMMAREFHESSLKSPAQIEKILHKSQFPKIEPYIASVSSGSTLVSAADPRPEVKVLDAKSEFESLDLLS